MDEKLLRLKVSTDKNSWNNFTKYQVFDGILLFLNVNFVNYLKNSCILHIYSTTECFKSNLKDNVFQNWEIIQNYAIKNWYLKHIKIFPDNKEDKMKQFVITGIAYIQTLAVHNLCKMNISLPRSQITYDNVKNHMVKLCGMFTKPFAAKPYRM